MKVTESVSTHKPDTAIGRESLAGKGSRYAFDETGTETMETEAESLDELPSQLMNGVLKE